MNDAISTVNPKRAGQLFWLIVLIVIAVTITLAPSLNRALPDDRVYIDAPPYLSGVDMFTTLYGPVGDNYYTLSDRTRCTVLVARKDYKVDSGPPIAMYKLDCDGKIGYVHADWVSR